jgi:hypothetical protein
LDVPDSAKSDYQISHATAQSKEMSLKHSGNDLALAHHEIQHSLRLLDQPERNYFIEVSSQGKIDSGSSVDKVVTCDECKELF